MIKSKYIKKVPDGRGGFLYFYGGERIPTAHTKPHREATLAGDKAASIGKPSKRHHHKAAQSNEKAHRYYAGVQAQHSDHAQQAHADGNHERAEIHADMSKIYGQLSDHHHDESKRHHGHIRKLIDRKPKEQSEIPGYLATVKAKGIIMLKAKYTRKVPDGKGGWNYLYTNVVTGKKTAVSEETHEMHESAGDASHTATTTPSVVRANQVKMHQEAEAAHDKAAKHFDKKWNEHKGEAQELEKKGDTKEADKKWDVAIAHYDLSTHHKDRRDKHTAEHGKIAGRKAEKTRTRKGVILLKAKYIQKKPDGKGGFRYIYKDTETHLKHGKIAQGHMDRARKSSERADKSNTTADHAIAFEHHSEASIFHSRVKVKMSRQLYRDTPKGSKDAEKLRAQLVAHHKLEKHHDDKSMEHIDKWNAIAKKETKGTRKSTGTIGV